MTRSTKQNRIIDKSPTRYSKWVRTPSPYRIDAEYTSPEYPISEVLQTIPKENEDALLEQALYIGINYVINKHQKQGVVLSDYFLIELAYNVEWHIYTHSNVKMSISVMVDHMRKLMLNPKAKIIFIPARIMITHDAEDTHWIWIIIDKVRKVVEFYDPHGSFEKSDRIPNIIKSLFVCDRKNETTCFIPQKYKIISFQDSCPTFGFQVLETTYGFNIPEDLSGYCAFWSLFFMDLRLSNIGIGTKEIQEYFIHRRGGMKAAKKLGEEFRRFIRQYTHYWVSLTNRR